MTKTSERSSSARVIRRSAADAFEHPRERDRAAHSQKKADHAVVSKARFEAVMRAAAQSGLLGEKSGRIGGRVSPALVRQAKQQTGIDTDTDLIEFALATIALEDDFAETFRQSRGKVDARLKLGF